MKVPAKYLVTRVILLGSLAVITLAMYSTQAVAQQDAVYGQYMFNNVVVNPATAGLENQVSLILLYKNQWVSMPDAPKGQSFSFDGPVNNDIFKGKLGLGVHFVGDQFGPNKNTGVFGSVSYKFKLGKNNLALGIRGGLKNYILDWGRIEYASGLKGGEDYNQSTNTATVGLGAHFYTKRFYIGLVRDNFTAPSLKLEKSGVNPYGSVYGSSMLTVGYDFKINDKLNFLPSILLKGTSYKPEVDTSGASTNTSGDVRLTGRFLFLQKYWIGLGITEAGGNALLGARIGDNLMVGVAFNSSAADVRSSTGSGHEIILGYYIKAKKSIVKLHLVDEAGAVIMIAKKGKGDYFTFEKLPKQSSYIFKMESEDSTLLAMTKEVEVRYKDEDGKEIIIVVSKGHDEFFRYEFLPTIEEENLFAINEEGDTVGVALRNPEGYFVFEYLPNDRNLIFIQSDNIENTEMIISVWINDKMIKLSKGDDAYFRFEILPPEVVTLYLLSDDGDTLGSAGLNSDGFFVFEKLPIDQNYLFFLDARDAELIDQVQILQLDKTGKDRVLTLEKGDDKFFRFEYLEHEESKLYLLNQKGDTLMSTIRNSDGFFVFEKLPIDQSFIFMLDGSEAILIDDILVLTKDAKGKDKIITASKGADNLFRYESLPFSKVSDPGLLEPDEVAFILNNLDQRILRTTYESLKFNTGEAIIKLESYPYLEALCQMLILHSEWRIILSGFTDNVGADGYNLLLSKQRAETVKRALVKRNVPREQVRVKFYGESHPLETNDTEEGRSKNRRVEMRIVKIRVDGK